MNGFMVFDELLLRQCRIAGQQNGKFDYDRLLARNLLGRLQGAAYIHYTTRFLRDGSISGRKGAFRLRTPSNFPCLRGD